MTTIKSGLTPLEKLAANSMEAFERKERRSNLLVDITNAELVDFENKKLDWDVFSGLVEAPLELTILGASSLQLVIHDPNWEVLNDPIFSENWRLEVVKKTEEGGVNKEEKAENEAEVEWVLPERPIDLNVDGIWFRLVGFQTNETQLTLTFEDRVAAILREEKGKQISIARGKVTRAQFVAHLISLAEKGPHNHNYGKIPFFCPEENIVQPIAAETKKEAEEKNKAENSAEKESSSTSGSALSSSSGATVKGTAANPAQLKVLNEALEVAAGEPTKAKVALIEAIIQESDAENITTGTGSSQGVLQVTAETAQSAGISATNVKQCVKAFLEGYKARETPAELCKNKPNLNPAEIAQEIQKSAYEGNSTYGQWAGEAEKIVSAYGGSSSTTSGTTAPTSTETPYEFTRGTNQTSWDCAMKLAEEIGWKFFVRNNICFYCSGNFLLDQQPRMTVIRQRNEVDWINVDVDLGSQDGLAEVEVLGRAKGFGALPGEAVAVPGIGPASGRWVVSTATQDLKDPSHAVKVKLEKPLPAKKESSKSENQEETATAGAEGSAAAAYAAAAEMSSWQLPYVYGGGHSSFADIKKGGEGVDCSGSTSWVLHKAGMGVTAPQDSTDLEQWGEPGQGKEMTVWTNAQHAFIEFNVRGREQFNTNGPVNGPHLYVLSQEQTYDPNPGSESLNGEPFQARHWKGT